MAEEEEVAARTEKVIRIQRVFINLLDSYSSRNIGKVSGGGSQQNPSPQLPVPRPRPRTQRGPAPPGAIRASPKGPSLVLGTANAPCSPVCTQARQAPHLEAQVFGDLRSSRGSSPVNKRKLRLRGRKGLAQDHLASWGQDLDIGPGLRPPNRVLFPFPPTRLNQATDGKRSPKLNAITKH